MPLLFFVTLSLQMIVPVQPAAANQPFYGPAFQLTATPTRPLLEQGGSTTVTVTLETRSSADFHLRFEGVPASVKAGISALKPGANAIVFTCSPNTPTGVYAIQITAAAGDNQQTQTIPFVIHPKGNLGPR